MDLITTQNTAKMSEWAPNIIKYTEYKTRLNMTWVSSMFIHISQDLTANMSSLVSDCTIDKHYAMTQVFVKMSQKLKSGLLSHPLYT